MIDKAQRELRNALGTFATGVMVVTAVDASGKPYGMTANSFASVSLDPPLVLWNVGRDAWCYSDFCAAKHFAIHVLTENQQHVAEHFAKKNVDKFGAISWHSGPHGVPKFDEFMTCFLCRAERLVEGGDHSIIIAKVDSYDLRPQSQPLLFYRGEYHRMHHSGTE